MRNTTETKKDKIKNWCKENKEHIEEMIAIIISCTFAILLYALNVNTPRGVQVLLTILLCYTMYNQFYLQRIDNKINEMKKQENKQ